MTGPVFDEAFAAKFAELLIWRRDVRHFLKEPVEAALLDRLIAMACLAPSVGHSQPWRFVKVDEAARRLAVRENFLACNKAALADYEGERARLYASLKLAGLDEAPVHLAVFCDRRTETGHGLGQKTMPETLDFSVVAAIQALWLAARIHGLGVGWVSIVDPDEIGRILDVPIGWSLIAYLCIGRPLEESDTPELVRLGWQDRESFGKFILER